MQKSDQAHREEFAALGYTIFEGVLTPTEVAAAAPLFDEIITPDTQPPVVIAAQARRQLNSSLYCEPRLANLGGHPKIVAAAQVLMGGAVQLMRSPVPCITFPGPTGGALGPQWRGHVDWHNTPPSEAETRFIYGLVHFTTVAPGGGGFTVHPGSHRLIMESLLDPQGSEPPLRERTFAQQFGEFPGLEPPREICAHAGDVLFYHALLVHGASDNESQQPRKILFTHYMPPLDAATRASIGVDKPGFHPDHIAAMDAAMRQLCGL